MPRAARLSQATASAGLPPPTAGALLRMTYQGIRERQFAALIRKGFGDLNQHGPDAFRFYTKTKTVTSRWPSGVKEGAEFVIPTMN